MRKAHAFIKDESGAVTVDWVVLTAAIVVMVLGAISAISPAVSTQVSLIAIEVNKANSQ